ncbi:MAG: LPS export ABC transporter periplasmic protein LptC [Nitrospirota bacterium]
MKRVLLIGLSISLVCMLFVLLRNDREISGDLKIKGYSFIEGLKILHQKDGITVWTLSARKADFIEGEDKAELAGISVVTQKNDMVLHANKGVYDLSDQRFTTDGEIKAEAKDYTITADSIDYDASSGEIKTEGWIRVEGKKFKVEGRVMKADAEQKMSILNDVRATFYK